MSAPRGVHLLCAGEALTEGYRHGGHLALCGEPIGAPGLPDVSCPDECDCEVTYCLGCLDAANKRHGEAGYLQVSPYRRSSAGADTHRRDYSTVTLSVHAVCGGEFVPEELPLGGPQVRTR